MDNNDKWYQNRWVQILGVVLIFLLIALAYFYPAAFEDRVLYQADGAAASGTGRDVVEYQEQTGERSFWTGSLFGGMPTYQISPSYPSAEGIKTVQNIYRLRFPFLNLLPGDAYLIFMLLMGFYIFLMSWGVGRWLSVGGAIMWAFSSYFLILIDAGHLWKLLALCYIPPTIAGLVLAFKRRRYLLGFFVTALFSALQIYSNHIQMSYYFAFLMVAMIVAWAINAGKNKDWSHFCKALGVVVAGGLIGIAINGTSLYHTYEYSKETMRGGREITVLDEDNVSQVNAKGLDHEYIMQWSYGIDEMLTFLVPDAKGGATGYIGSDEVRNSEIKNPQLQQIVAQQNRYWGDQPFTAGPVYVGAFVLLLAIFGAIVTKGPMKWCLLIVTVLTIMLSWGHNMMWLSELFIDYFPLYSKFRTPSSILVVAEFTIPLFAIMGLMTILKDPLYLKRNKVALYVATALTLGVVLLLYFVPSLYSGFISKPEREAFASMMAQNPEVGLVRNALESVRISIFKADALRSAFILVGGLLMLYLYYKHKIGQKVLAPLCVILCFVDLWSVDKRYLNDDKYIPKSQVDAKIAYTTPADELILRDTAQFRVMNLMVNTFNDATTSYNHRSIGGYHAAKLQRYQDVIEGYLAHRNPNLLRALNTKYYIVPDSLGMPHAVTDAEAYGSAWFVSDVIRVGDANEEFQKIGEVALNKTAVVAPPFSERIPNQIETDTLSSVSLISYAPNHIKYISDNTHSGVAVFSEVYYPHGWYASIDGEPVDILRIDYILRGLVIPQGKHTIEFVFDPKSLHTTETIAIVANVLLLLAGFSLLVLNFLKRKGKVSL